MPHNPIHAAAFPVADDTAPLAETSVTSRIPGALDFGSEVRVPRGPGATLPEDPITITPAEANLVTAAAKPQTREAFNAVQALDEVIVSANKKAQTIERIGDQFAAIDPTAGIMEALEAEKTIAAQAGVADLTAQNNRIAFHQAQGGIEEQIKFATSLRDDRREREDLENIIADKKDVLGGGLVGEIVGAFTSIPDRLRLEALNEDILTTEQSLAGISAATESVGRTTALTKRTVNLGTIAAGRRLLEADAARVSAKSQREALRDNATMIAAASQGDRNVVAAIQAKQSFDSTEEARVIRDETQQFRRKQEADRVAAFIQSSDSNKVALEQQRLNLEEALANKDINELQRDKIRLQVQKLQETEDRNEEFRASTIESVHNAETVLRLALTPDDTIMHQYTKGTKEERTRIAELSLMGSQAVIQVGKTAGDSSVNLVTLAPGAARPKNKPTLALKNINAEVQKHLVENPQDTPTTVEGQVALINAFVKPVMDAAEGNIIFGDGTNPYQAPPFTVLSQQQVIRDTAFYQKVLKDRDLTETDPNTLVQLAAGAMNTLITPTEAAEGLTVIFNQAAILNNAEGGGFDRYGLPIQNSYITEIEVPISSSGAIQNLLDQPFPSIDSAIFSGLASVAEFAELEGAEESLKALAEEATAPPIDIIKTDMMKFTQNMELLIKIANSLPSEASETTTP